MGAPPFEPLNSSERSSGLARPGVARLDGLVFGDPFLEMKGVWGGVCSSTLLISFIYRLACGLWVVTIGMGCALVRSFDDGSILWDELEFFVIKRIGDFDVSGDVSSVVLGYRVQPKLI